MYQRNPLLVVRACADDTTISGGFSYEVYKGGDEGDYIPHMHIHSRTGKPHDKGYFETCLKLDDAEYFIHKDYHTHFASWQKKQALKFLKRPYKGYKSVWHYLADAWNMKVSMDRNTRSTRRNPPDYSVIPTIGNI